MNIIRKLTDLDRLVATSAFCPEPPASERRAIHESGAWRWVPSSRCTCQNCLFGGYAPMHDITGHWEPAAFSTDPAASYALERRMQWLGLNWSMELMGQWLVKLQFLKTVTDLHESRLIAMCLAALRALGVEFTLAEGWDK